MNDQEKIRERLKRILCNVECHGCDRRGGGCGFRQSNRCNVIEKLDLCMISAISESLIAAGVTFSEDSTNEI